MWLHAPEVCTCVLLGSLPNWCGISCLSLFGMHPQNMDGPFYERVRLYYSRYAEAELDFCSQMAQELRQLQRDAALVRAAL